jgi:hypothetical protein
VVGLGDGLLVGEVRALGGFAFRLLKLGAAVVDCSEGAEADDRRVDAELLAGGERDVLEGLRVPFICVFRPFAGETWRERRAAEFGYELA